MPEPHSPSAEPVERYALEQEVRTLQARLAQREATIVALNRRLRRLEQQSEEAESLVAAELRAKALEAELQAIYQTKTFRLTNSLRRIYGWTLVRREGQ